MARWDKPDIPHKGWTFVACLDLGEYAYGGDESRYETCEMCHQERIRYVHILTHPGYPGEIRVGCNCACKMTEDYVTPRENERKLVNKSSRKNNFLKQPWIKNEKGNWVLRYKGSHITAIMRNGQYGFVYNNCWVWRFHGQAIYDLDTLKLAAFEKFDDVED